MGEIIDFKKPKSSKRLKREADLIPEFKNIKNSLFNLFTIKGYHIHQFHIENADGKIFIGVCIKR